MGSRDAKVPAEVTVAIPGHLPEVVRMRIYRKLKAAGERDSRVVFQRNVETQVALDIAQQMDKAMSILLRRVSRESNTVVPLITGWFDALSKLNQVAEQTCREAGIPYRVPRSLARKEEEQEGTQDIRDALAAGGPLSE